MHADKRLPPERRMYANPHSSDAHGPKQMTAVSTACRARHRQSPNSEERSTLPTTLLGIHTMDRRHCEAARRQQARVTAGGPSFDRTRAGAEKFGPKQPPHRLHAPARSPQAQGGARRGPHWPAVFIPLSKCGVPPHTEYILRKNAGVGVLRFEPASGVLQSKSIRIY